MLQGILLWLAEKTLFWFLGKALKEVKDKASEIAKEAEQGKINDTNLKAYEEAKDRLERIKAATDLLNGTDRNAT